MKRPNFADQGKLGSPSDFAAMPGVAALFRTPGPKPRVPEPYVDYDYAWIIEVSALKPREVLETLEVRDGDERDEVAAWLRDEYTALNRSRPIWICSTPIVATQREKEE